jgi:predicted porin
MRRSNAIIPSLVVLFFSSEAYAQSSVTLYGILDDGIGYVHNSGGKSTQVQMMLGMAGPRWGLKGNEDLGGGMAAVFDLENGFSVGNGKMNRTGTQFDRQAWVGLSSSSYGTVTVGRQYDPLTDQVQPLTADWVYGPIFASPGDLDNYDDSVRFNNSIKWTSASYSGLQVAGMYAFGGTPGTVSSGQTWSAALGYHVGAFALGAGLTHIDNGNDTLGLRGTSTSDSLFNSPVNAGYASSRSVSIARVVGEYKSATITAGLGYSLSSYNRDAASTFAQNEHFHNASIFGAYNITPAWTAGAGYNYTRAIGDAAATYHSVQIGTNYSLSKRTQVYAIAGYVHAIGNQRDASGNLQTAQAVVGAFDIASGASTQELAIVGIQHRF